MEEREQYGYRSAEQVAQLLASTGQDPRVYLSVATYIDEQMFADIVDFNRRDCTKGWRITWDHVAILARHSSYEFKRSLLTRCMNERLSVQQLRVLSSALRRG
jgi:hypothetical protein